MTLPPASPEIIERIRELLSGLVLRDVEEIRSDTLLVQDLDVDSLGFIELTFAIEDQFGVSFPDLKTNAQMYALALPDALEQIEAMDGGTTLLEFAKLAVVVGDAAALEAGEANERFRSATAAHLARALGGALPSAVAPETPLSELYLVDAFRFISVEIVARYVAFLQRQRVAAP